MKDHREIIGKVIQEEMFGMVFGHFVITEMGESDGKRFIYEGLDRGCSYVCTMKYLNDRQDRAKEHPTMIFDELTLNELLTKDDSQCSIPEYSTLFYRVVPDAPDPMLKYPYSPAKAQA
jgi:hypothetical protein